MARKDDVSAPDPKRLRILIDTVYADPMIQDDERECRDALEWLHTFLINRRGYHKRVQLKKKFLIEYAKKALGEEEIKTINEQVNAAHFEQVANEPPDEEEIEEILHGGSKHD